MNADERAPGLARQVGVVASIHMLVPVGRLRLPHAAIGAVVATVRREITRRVLEWYFATLWQIRTVYGSLTTAIAALSSLEPAATLLPLGAQVIAEYERIGTPRALAAPEPMQLGAD